MRLIFFKKQHILIYYVSITYQIKMKELLYLKDEQIKDFIEKIFYAYRETFSDPKKILNKYSFGVAHLKVLNLISRYEGITISKLLIKLKVTKQSLNRVLRDLSKSDVIIYKQGIKDSRLKHLYLNEKGKNLSDEFFNQQKKRIYNALRNSSPDSVIHFNNVIKKIING